MRDKMETKVYKRRWFLLAVICLLNFSMNMTWITFVPVSSYTINYYGNNYAPTIYNMVFMLCSPIGFLAMHVLSKKNGLRIGCLIGAWLNLAGNLIRLYAASHGHPLELGHQSARFWITLFGQCLSAFAQPFVIYLPTKLAAIWFPDSQRVVANSLASLSNPIGAATMYLLAPHIVNDKRPTAFFLLTGIVATPAILGAILSLGVVSSRPPMPPSASARAKANKEDQGSELKDQKPALSRGLLGDIRQAFSQKSFIILALGLGSGFGLFNALYNNLQPALCSKGYSNRFSGSMGALMIVSGLVGSSVFGVFVDRTRLFEETMKVLLCLTALASTALMMLFQFAQMQVFIVPAIICFGATALAIYPLGLELGVETTYPIPEATSTGLLIFVGQFFGVIYITLTTLLRQTPTEDELSLQTCISNENPSGVYNWKHAMMVWSSLVVLTSTLFTLTFWPKYRRMEYEKRESRQNKLLQEQQQ